MIEKIGDVSEKSIGFPILIGVQKSESENILQL